MAVKLKGAKKNPYDEAVEHLKRADPVLRRLIKRVGPCRFKPYARRSYFESLTASIVYQQLATPAAKAIFARLKMTANRIKTASRADLKPGKLSPQGSTSVLRLSIRPADVLELGPARIRSAGLSRKKAEYLTDLAERFMDKRIPVRRFRRLSDSELIDLLTRLPGFGRWSVEIFLIYRLGRLDVLPLGDYGFKRAVKLNYDFDRIPSDAEIIRIAECWRPYRTIAVWYLWQTLK